MEAQLSIEQGVVLGHASLAMAGMEGNQRPMEFEPPEVSSVGGRSEAH